MRRKAVGVNAKWGRFRWDYSGTTEERQGRAQAYLTAKVETNEAWWPGSDSVLVCFPPVGFRTCLSLSSGCRSTVCVPPSVLHLFPPLLYTHAHPLPLHSHLTVAAAPVPSYALYTSLYTHTRPLSFLHARTIPFSPPPPPPIPYRPPLSAPRTRERTRSLSARSHPQP